MTPKLLKHLLIIAILVSILAGLNFARLDRFDVVACFLIILNSFAFALVNVQEQERRFNETRKQGNVIFDNNIDIPLSQQEYMMPEELHRFVSVRILERFLNEKCNDMEFSQVGSHKERIQALKELIKSVNTSHLVNYVLQVSFYIDNENDLSTIEIKHTNIQPE